MHRYSKQLIIFLSCMLCLAMQLTGNAARGAEPISAAQWQQLTNDKAFDYKNDSEIIQKPVTYKQGAFEKALINFFRFWASKTGNVILWILVISIVCYIVYKVFYRNDSFLFGKRNKIMTTAAATGNDEQDLVNTNWEVLLQQALDNTDYRLAVRYSYMWMLQLMQQRELIQYRIDKTNYEYYTELNNTSYKQAFKQLSRQYEYAWYGGFAPSALAYNDYKGQFDNIRRSLGA